MRVLCDFEAEASIQRWHLVNDDVMGGRSVGRAGVNDGVMVFAGTINTNGGGFCSVRRWLEPGVLAGAERVRLRVKTDGRPYRLIVEDDLESRPRRITHRQEIDFGPADAGWQTVEVVLADLIPSWRGRPVDAEPLRADRAVRLGIMLNDVEDGPFRLEVERIEVVR